MDLFIENANYMHIGVLFLWVMWMNDLFQTGSY